MCKIKIIHVNQYKRFAMMLMKEPKRIGYNSECINLVLLLFTQLDA